MPTDPRTGQRNVRRPAAAPATITRSPMVALVVTVTAMAGGLLVLHGLVGGDFATAPLHAQPAPASGPAGGELPDLLPESASPPKADPTAGEAAASVSASALKARARARKRQLEIRDLRDGIPTDPFEMLLRDFDDLAVLLSGDLHTGRETQRRGQRAIELLDKLIEEAISRGPPDDSGASGAGQAGPPPQARAGGQMAGDDGPLNQGANAPGDANNTVGGDPAGRTPRRADAAVPLLKAWGQLPPKLREQILIGVGETPHPDYKTLVDSYYLRLAEIPGSTAPAPGQATP